MQIRFKKTKELKVYEDFVEHPTDRKAFRTFLRYYPNDIVQESVKRHSLLKQYHTAMDYNKVYGQTANRIEIKDGTKNNQPLILKTRVTGSWRKFFYVVADEEGYLLTKDWVGKFDEVRSIYVIDVNKHDYNAV